MHMELGSVCVCVCVCCGCVGIHKAAGLQASSSVCVDTRVLRRRAVAVAKLAVSSVISHKVLKQANGAAARGGETLESAPSQESSSTQ